MTSNHEALQWLLDNSAELTFKKFEDTFSLRVVVKDPQGGQAHHTEFYIENVDLHPNCIALVATGLKESING